VFGLVIDSFAGRVIPWFPKPWPGKYIMGRLIKKIVGPNWSVEGEDLRVIDVSTGSYSTSVGFTRIADYNRTLDGIVLEGQDVIVSAGYIVDEVEQFETIFEGTIKELDGSDLKVLRLNGLGDKLKNINFIQSYKVVEPERILKDILKTGGFTNFELGSIPRDRRHTYIAPKEPLIDAINRVNDAFDLELIPFINESGIIMLKAFDELIIQTDIDFQEGEYDSFENDVLKTNFDPEVKTFNQIKILTDDYLATENRKIITNDSVESVISVSKI